MGHASGIRSLRVVGGAYRGGAGDNQRGTEKAFLGNTWAIGYLAVNLSFCPFVSIYPFGVHC